MSNQGFEIQENQIIFHNLVREGEIIGETRPVIAVKPATAVTNNNAKGGLRQVENLQAIGELAYSAAGEFKARF